MKKIFRLIFIYIYIGCSSFSLSIFAEQTSKANIKEKLNSDRVINSLDMLQVHVFGEPEFSGPNNSGLDFRVSSSGEISLYLLGAVKVAGKTPSEAERHIRALLMKGYIRDPHVLVQVKTYRVTNVTIMGQVGKPGLVALPAEQKIDIITGIAQAGGFGQLAKTSKIELTRDGITNVYDLSKLKKETDPKKKVWLESGDLIWVRESAF
jgi:protein involved in polysaccharide export with SLBB domain